MKKHSLKDWFVATRPWSFPVSAIPVAATFALLAAINGFSQLNLLNFVLALVGIIIFHAAGNVLSDWADYRNGVDNKEAYAVPNLVFGHFQPAEYLRYGCLLLAAGLVIGILLTLLSGPMLLIIGGLGVLLTLCYSFFKGHALGELVIFVNFAILPMLGTSFVVTGALDFQTLLLSLPIGFITVAVLFINNTRDIASDGAAGIRTFPMSLGAGTAVKCYQGLILMPYLYLVVMVVLGFLPWLCLIALVGLLPAKGILSSASQFSAKGNECILALDEKTAQMQLVFGLALSVGLLLAAII